MMDSTNRFSIMNKINERQYPRRIEVKHPNIHFVDNYRFQKKIREIRNTRIITSKITKEIQICFLERESYNRLKYQILCLDLEVEAEHIGELSIFRKRTNVFNNVIIYANLSGKLVDVLNFEQLQKRWKNVKKKLLQKYDGNVFLNYLKETDTLLEKKETILSYLSSKEMYGLYFNECWGIHYTDKPRFEGLEINVNFDKNETNEELDYSKVHIIYELETEQKIQNIQFHFIKSKLYEVIAEIAETEFNSKYSMVCLTPII